MWVLGLFRSICVKASGRHASTQVTAAFSRSSVARALSCAPSINHVFEVRAGADGVTAVSQAREMKIEDASSVRTQGELPRQR